MPPATVLSCMCLLSSWIKIIMGESITQSLQKGSHFPIGIICNKVFFLTIVNNINCFNFQHTINRTRQEQTFLPLCPLQCLWFYQNQHTCRGRLKESLIFLICPSHFKYIHLIWTSEVKLKRLKMLYTCIKGNTKPNHVHLYITEIFVKNYCTCPTS